MARNEYEERYDRRDEDKKRYDKENEYEEFHGKRIQVITREGSHHTLNGILGGESETKLFLNDIYFSDSWGHLGETKAIVSKDKIILAYLILPKAPEKD